MDIGTLTIVAGLVVVFVVCLIPTKPTKIILVKEDE